MQQIRKASDSPSLPAVRALSLSATAHSASSREQERFCLWRYSSEDVYKRQVIKIPDIHSNTQPLIARGFRDLKICLLYTSRCVSETGPNLLDSIAEATISKVFPAPTSCASSVFPPYSTWAVSYTHLDVYKRQHLWLF